MAAEKGEEPHRRKRFTLLQKDDTVYLARSRNNPADHTLSSENINGSLNTENYNQNTQSVNYKQSEDQIFEDDMPIINFKEEPRDEDGVAVAPQRGRPKKKNDSLEWSDEATEALIDLWGSKGELFDKSHPHFYQREMKDQAVEDIRRGLKSRGINITSNQILSKFQSLRTYFCSQRTKLTQSKKYGNIKDDVECKWRFFKSLNFLDDNMKVREGYSHKRRFDGELSCNTTPYFRSMVVKEESNSSHDYTEAAMSPGFNYPSSRQHENSFVKLEHNDVITPDRKTDDQLFGELVGNMVQQIPQGEAKDLLKLEIQQLIVKAKYATSPSQDIN